MWKHFRHRHSRIVCRLRRGKHQRGRGGRICERSARGEEGGAGEGFFPSPLRGLHLPRRGHAVYTKEYSANELHCNRFLEHFKTPEEKENDNRLPEVALKT